MNISPYTVKQIIFLVAQTWQIEEANQNQPFIILAILRRACNEFAVPIFATWRQGNSATCVDVEAVANCL